MKKKIVYISGTDTFDVNDVRAAFEEVRNTLKLDRDTVLFGVPVDEAESVGDVVEPGVAAESDLDVAPVAEIESVDAVVPEETVPEIAQADAVAEQNAPVVPILSVLASQEENVIVPEPVVDDIVPDPVVDDAEPVVDTESPMAESSIEFDNAEPDIADMINDELPQEPGEKTLEELLETMAPLREDVATPRKKKSVKVTPTAETTDETDATLENLASEFAENQDKVVSTKKGSERGKIGKLKNILPFKKMKRDDSGLMGDLFGWAGIAANDDDFTIPGFFKQKM